MLAPPLLAMSTAIGPIIRTLNRFANAVVRVSGREPKEEVASVFTREEVADLVAESRREGLLDEDEHQRITSALDFDTTAVASVMVPDPEVVSVRPGVTAAEIERICALTGFSRFPILEEDGRYSGYLHIRDVVDVPAERRDEPLPADRIRVLPSVPPTTDLRAALDRMRRIGAHLAEVAPRPPAAAADQVGAPETVGVATTERTAIERNGSEHTGSEPAGTEPGAAVAAPARGVVMLEDVIEALIGEIRDATRRSPDRAPDRPNSGQA
jgi:CBS domain containing-hemolysin-like protein